MVVRAVAMATRFVQKIALITSLQEIEKFFACTVGISGLVNFNTLSEFLRERRELPGQPNLNKKAKIALISLLCKKSRTFSHEKSGFWFGDFKYAISIFKGTKGVAMATKIGRNKPKLHK